MAIISRKDLLREVMPALNQLFEEAYATFDPQTYIKEVDFGHDKPEGTRGSTQTIHSTPSGSDGSN